ncbi:CopM family metallochaperone [Methylobacterium nodulans]|uniref:DUF305 domain-containing protein n=1 Tax=Methylobacterium nodulans (strain LMG 21967 / CNCM I-2342 / ORS 2060) TaxID=460265 RepID=B8IQE4_METNO|nr:DUF305 domain-containing protein [Methylobacterium nodulans]ACL60456.1 protein of unknown function DUF305 [Methylobacterium nodulans ORS 2060]
MTRTLLAALLATGLAGAALAHDSHGHQAMPKGGMQTDKQAMMADMMPAPGDAPSTRAFKETHMSMMHAMQLGYTGDPDIDFRTHMIPHHQGAIDMAKVALTHAKDPQTKAMAQKIIDDQEKEIADMRAWLKQRGR